MTIDDLKAYRYMAAEIEALQLQIAQLYSPVRSPNLVSIGARGNSTSDPTHSSVMLADELQRQLEEKQEILRAKAVRSCRRIVCRHACHGQRRQKHDTCQQKCKKFVWH